MANANYNNGIIDAIINANVHPPAAPAPNPLARPAAPAARPGHSFVLGDTATANALSHVRDLAEGAYRGMGRNVSMLGNDPVAIASAAGLDWRTVPMPLLIQGKRENRPYPGMAALVRSDNGHPLAVATTSYKPHNNNELLRTITDFAKASDLTVARVGLYDEGTNGFAIATSDVRGEVKVGDTVAMQIALRFGHEPGIATKFSARAFRLICSNGATVAVAGGHARFVHSRELTPDRIREAAQFVRAAAAAFGVHVETLRALYAAPSNKGLDLLQLAALYQPELAQAVADRLRVVNNFAPASSTPVDEGVLGRRVIQALLERDRSQQIVSQMIAKDGDRLLNAVISATATQPGGNYTVGTVAHAYNGVTHFNSNLRGRNAGTGLESAMWGTGVADATAAMAQAVQVAETVQSLRQ